MTNRNKEMYLAYLNGKKIVEIAKDYCITSQTVSRIITKQRMKDEKLNDELYIMLLEISRSEQLATRAYNVLIRMNISKVDDVKNVDVERLMKTRNCGRKTYDIIMEAMKM